MAEKHKSVSKLYQNIIKSENDSRTYCGLELVNGMRALLISDPTTDISAGALNVHIGSMSDPRHVPGLAHFCEHMLFLGNAKYPAENGFQEFLQKHSGSTNAETRNDSTCYYFDISSDWLKEALERFAQFFLCPLFSESATEREVNAVDSEFKKQLQMDGFRLHQVAKAVCDPMHDYNKFGWGNAETLWKIPKSKGIDIREELLKFHDQYYSANIMALVILGKETITELIDTVVTWFSDVPNKSVQIPEWEDNPFPCNLQVFTVPVKDIKMLKVLFPLPDLNHLYKSAPQFCLSFLINYEYPGSLYAELKEYAWINTLYSTYNVEAKGFGFFCVEFNLTEEGTGHIHDIVTLLFQYLFMLKQEGIPKWLCEEYKDVFSTQFRFKNKEEPMYYTLDLASKMFKYPMEDILSSYYLLESYQPNHIKNFLDMLAAEKVMLLVTNKKYESTCTNIEKWSGALYTSMQIPAAVIDIWSNVNPLSYFNLPPPNEFIPTSLNLVTREQNNPEYPQLIRNTAMCRLWFKQDNEFMLPKAILNIELQSSVSFSDPLQFNMIILFVALVNDSLNGDDYSAELAGLSYYLTLSARGIYLKVTGYNDKQHIFLKKIITRMTNIKINEKRFDNLKESYGRCLKNSKANQPNTQAKSYMSYILQNYLWTKEELLGCFDEVTLDHVQEMIPRLFSRVHIEALMYGNLTQQRAFELMDIIEDTLKNNVNVRCLLPRQLATFREIQIPDGHYYVYESVNDVHSDSAIEVYYQCGANEARLNIIVEALCFVLEKPCYNFLRTQEQLGYLVACCVRRSHSVQGISILVQSRRKPYHIDEKIEAFIHYVDKYIKEITDEEFKTFVQSLSKSRLIKPKNLSMQAAEYWYEISSKFYNFNRDAIEVADLQTITKEDVYSFFKELVACDAPKRKKLSVHVKSVSRETATDTQEDLQALSPFESRNGSVSLPPTLGKPKRIDDVMTFKQSLGLYPLVLPSINIPLPLT